MEPDDGPDDGPSEETIKALAYNDSVTVAFVDCETTGLDYRADHIIELAVLGATYMVGTGAFYSINFTHSWLNDPGVPVPEEVTQLTGIDDAMVRGKSLPLDDLQQVFASYDYVVAHNATFDRGFIESAGVTGIKQWACTLRQIDWHRERMYSRTLRALMWEHGLRPSVSHGAMADIEDLHRLMCRRPKDNFLRPPFQTPEQQVHLHRTYMDELLETCQRPMEILVLTGPFNEKNNEVMRGQGFRFARSRKSWYIVQYQDETKRRLELLAEAGYNALKTFARTEDCPDMLRPDFTEFHSLD